ncbi:MAG: Crp/Fnr family transcriptional regulator [Proteobacteria bacterium]|nr:Crp/Fnr family transcriptional regulator [Pseudomonadota bacterium]
MDQHDRLDSFRRYLSNFGPLPDSQWAHLESILGFKNYGVGEFFQRPQETAMNLGFVLSGLFRVFYQDAGGKEFTRAFSEEANPIGDYASALEGGLAKVSIQALELSQVAFIRYEDYFSLFTRHPCWDRIGRRIIESYYVVREKREAEFAMCSAPQRYENFLKIHSRIATRATNAQIASFLGITPETLSRLKTSGRQR